MKKIFAGLSVVVLMGGGIGSWFYYNFTIASATNFEKEYTDIYIAKEASFEDVVKIIESKKVVNKIGAFKRVSKLKKYPALIKGGKYRIKKGATYEGIVNKLRSGDQIPVKLTFNNVRLLEELAGKVASHLEVDSTTVLKHLKDNDFLSQYGVDSKSSMILFIPNTYEVWWNMSIKQLFDRMAREFKNFWNIDRKKQAKALGLSQSDVYTLASIVQAEQGMKPQEWPDIAGLYLNRLKKGMKLESDPTLIFAKKDFTIRRVLNADKKIESPYNTYKYRGLPPGMIRLPDPRAMDAILNHKKHDYIFMCAKGDGSGFHRFAKTYKEHKKNARKYHQDLNAKGIYR